MGVLVTGGAGFIGSHAVLAALEAGRRVVVLDDLSTGVREAVPRGARFVLGSIRDTALVERIVGEHAIDSVLHFAARTVAPDSLRSPLAYYQANVAWTCGLISASVKAGVGAFVLSSTAAVYGEPGPRPVREDAPLSPSTPYGASKAMAERMLKDAARATRLSYAVLRYFNVAGCDPHGRTPASGRTAPHLVSAACEGALSGEALQVFGTDYPTPDGTAVRDFVHVSDVAAAHLLALDALQTRRSLTLNLGSGRGWSVLQVAEAVRRVTGAALPLALLGRRPGDPACAVADTRRAAAEIGWTLRYDLEQMIAHTVARCRPPPLVTRAPALPAVFETGGT